MKILRTDILVRSPNGRDIALVEVKNRRNFSPEIAGMVRQQMLEYAQFSQVPYFLLLSQDKGFLWKEPITRSIDALPSYEFPMDSVVARYSHGTDNGNGTDRLKEQYLELLFLQWLLDLSNNPQRIEDEPEKSLAHSGFLESIQGAAILADL